MKKESSSFVLPRVLIVGGGLAGLSAAMFLAWRGVGVTLVEKRPGSSAHPRAIGFTTRTLELFRAVGIDSSIPQAPLGHGRPRRVAVESLAGKWFEEAEWNSGASKADDARSTAKRRSSLHVEWVSRPGCSGPLMQKTRSPAGTGSRG